MPATTPGQSLPVPVAGDDPNIPDDLNSLALAIEKRLVGVYNTIADRDARVTAPQEGQFAYLKDTNVFTFYNGTAWAPYPAVAPVISSGTTVPSNASGANGDIYFKV